MSNIFIKDANNTTLEIFTFEDSTSVHHNASVPILQDGTVIFTSANPGIVQALGGGASGSSITVSVGGAVSTQAVPVAGTDGTDVRLLLTDSAGRLITRVSNEVSIAPQNFGVTITNTGNVGVSIAGGDVKVSGGVLSIVQAVSLGGGTANIGTVSISPTQGNIPVSIGGGIVPVSINGFAKVHVCNAFVVSVADKVSVAGTVNAAQSGTWGVNINGAIVSSMADDNVAATNQGLYTKAFQHVFDGTTWDRWRGDVSVSPTQGNIPVSIGGGVVPVSINGFAKVHVCNARPAASVAGLVSVWPANTVVPDTDAKALQGFNHEVHIAAGYVYNRNSNTWDRMTGTSVGIAVLPVSIAPQILTVHVCNAQAAPSSDVSVSPTQAAIPVSIVNAINVSVPPITGGTQVVSVGGAASVQAVPIVGRDTNGNARQPLIVATGGAAGGALIVHVCNAQAAPSSDVSVSPTQGNIPVFAKGEFQSTRPNLTSGSVSPLQLDQRGNLGVTLYQNAVPNQFLTSVHDNTTEDASTYVFANKNLVYNRNSRTFDLMSGTSVGLQVVLWDNESNVAMHTVADNADAQATSSTGNRLAVVARNLVYNRASGTYDLMTGTSVGIPVSINPQILTVHVCNAHVVSVADKVSVAGRVSVVFDGNNANVPVSVPGVVNVSANGGRFDVSVSPSQGTIPVSVVSGRVSITGAVSISDKVSVAGLVSAHQNGTWTVQPGNTPNTAPWLVTDVPSSVDGSTPYVQLVSAFTSGYLVKGGAGKVYGIACGNVGSTPLYLRLYNKATAPNSSDTPVLVFVVPGNTAGAGFVLNTKPGIGFTTGIGWRISGGINNSDSTAPSDNQGIVNIFYK